MTSGTFQSVPTSSIFVNRATRQRRDISDEEINELADSIKRFGLIHPPVIQRSFELVVGERRWLACKALGWTHIPVQYIDDLPPDELIAVELEENIRRKDIPWQDNCRAVKAYHDHHLQRETNWTDQQTAEALGYSTESIRRKLNVAREMEQGNTMVLNAPRLSTAENIVVRKNERARASAFGQIDAFTNGDKVDMAPILRADFVDWSRDYTGEKFNMIHCDFPYGMNADKMDQGSSELHGGYDDSPTTFSKLLMVLGNAMDNIVDESAHLLFWFNMDFYSTTAYFLEDIGWRLDKRLLIWHKSDGTSILPDPARGPRWCYETAFFGSRGDRKIVRAVPNLISAPTSQKYHMSEKPVEVVQHFLRMTTDEYTNFLDPTCGSANSLIAARNQGARTILGLERDSGFYEGACENWRNSS